MQVCEALALPMYGRLFGYFISDAAPLKLPGAPFIVASALL